MYMYRIHVVAVFLLCELYVGGAHYPYSRVLVCRKFMVSKFGCEFSLSMSSSLYYYSHFYVHLLKLHDCDWGV